MKMDQLKKRILNEIETLEAEYTNIPEKEVFVRLEIEAWIDALEWVLEEIEKIRKKEVDKHE